MLNQINCEYIISSSISVPYEEIPSIYKQCFLGIRLTQQDGNANTVQEMGLMGIKCVHNGEFPNAINWFNLNDIIKIINEEKKKIGKKDENLANICLGYYIK